MSARLDHLVVVAHSLVQGLAWCEATLGVTPAPGGEHPRFGTHNRLLNISSAAFPQAYLEIIAINSEANYVASTPDKRWFDMDDPALQAAVATAPRLLHWVARTPDIAQACAALRGFGLERGPVVRASRETAEGLLRWQISVRSDGQRLMHGLLPTLIQWDAVHPAHYLPDQGVALQHLRLAHPQAALLQQACKAIHLQGPGQGMAWAQGPPQLCAALQTPKGLVTLASQGI